MNTKSAFIFTLFLFLSFALFGQKVDKGIIQFSGMVVDGTTTKMYPLPYANVMVKKEGRGTYSDFDGFFSIVIEKGDIIEFSALGYKTVEYQIPDSLENDRYSIVQLMTKDTFNLPETVVFPWPSREHFKLEFLAMDVTSELQQKATENLANETLERMRNVVASDGPENTSYYLRQQAKRTYYTGQNPPMNIFSPVAWSQFFEAWKNGDFKKKKKK